MNENKKERLLINLESIQGLFIGDFVMTSDLGLQFDYASAEGCGTCLGSMGEWPIYKIHDARLSQQWEVITSKIATEELILKDISDTVLEKITLSLEHQFGRFSEKKEPESKSITLSEFYSPLTKLALTKSESFFLMIDCAKWELDKLEVFSTVDEVLTRFKEKYCFFDSWDCFDEDTLVYWYKRINNELEPFNNFLLEE